ncbi:MAG TPA: tetratricopeptide repeat protein [Pirellulales bacterium]|nr:tetratricopeptide repeat protein [Pirellulales bacterium]
MVHKLIIFISSPAALKDQRDETERVLEGLEIDGSRFEAWPPAPVAVGGMAECFRRIDEADGIILLLGEKYGTVIERGLSATHLEYRHALSRKKPIFPFLLHAENRESQQVHFIDEVQATFFRGNSIRTPHDLAAQIRNALLQEFTRCFRQIHGGPPQPRYTPPAVALELVPDLFLSDDPKAAYEQLEQLYGAGHDKAIHQLAPQIELKFGHIPLITNFVHMANVNLAMNGEPIGPERLDSAIAFWEDPSLLKHTSAASLAYCQGNALGVLKRHEDAIACYKQALSLEPAFAMCWKNLGTSFVDVGNPGEAIHCFRQAVAHDPRQFEARYSLATMAMERGAYQDSLDELSQIRLVELPPVQQSWVHGRRAECLSHLGDHAAAIRAVEVAISLAPNIDWPWFYAARVYAIAQGDDTMWRDAARVFAERLASRFPENGQVWGNLGYAYWRSRLTAATPQLTRQCIVAFSRAIELGFLDDGLIPDRLGHIYSDEGKLGNAVEAFRLAAQHDPASFGYCLGSTLMQLGQYDEALGFIKGAAEKHQPDAMSWGNLGTCYDHVGDHRNAIAAYEKAIELDRTYAVAWFNLGGAYWNVGDRARALQIWGDAISRFPDDENAEKVRAFLSEPEQPR